VRLGLGAVGFGHALEDGRVERYDVMGQDRVDLLRLARHEQPLPGGLSLIGQQGEGYGWSTITHAEVRWEDFDFYENRRALERPRRLVMIVLETAGWRFEVDPTIGWALIRLPNGQTLSVVMSEPVGSDLPVDRISPPYEGEFGE
jgi:hypothetical protein